MTAHGGGMPARSYWATVAVGATYCRSGCVPGDLVAEWVIFAGPDAQPVISRRRCCGVRGG
jgi:hypothetical protein